MNDARGDTHHDTDNEDNGDTKSDEAGDLISDSEYAKPDTAPFNFLYDNGSKGNENEKASACRASISNQAICIRTRWSEST